jgi:hypothetical protein
VIEFHGKFERGRGIGIEIEKSDLPSSSMKT